MPIKITPRTALIVVDVQNDFCPSGSLPVPDGDKVVPIVNIYIKKFAEAGAPIYATRDWHPPAHISFITHGGPWPVHCVQGSKGAEFHNELSLPEGVAIISKGSDPGQDAYSGFQGTDLAAFLRKERIEQVCVGGLATDYCVKSTVLDALTCGFEVVFLEDASRGVDVHSGDSVRAIAEMVAQGAVRATLSDCV